MIQLKFIYGLCFLKFCLVIQTSGTYSKESVPLLIWSSEKQPLDIPAVPAIPIPFSHVEGKYLKAFNLNNIILFLTDTLSIEDLSSHEDVCKHINQYMENGHSLYLPAVETGTSIPHIFSAHGYNVITLEPGSAIGELKLKKNTPNLVVVKLPPTVTNPSRRNACLKNDEIMFSVLSKVGDEAPFTVMYTASEPSLKLESKVEHRRVTRAAPGNSSAEDGFFYTPCVILYMRKGFTIQKGNSSVVLPNSQSTESVADCRDNTEFMSISYRDIGDHQKIKVKLYFSRIRRYWTFDSAELTEMIDGNVQTVNLLPQWPMEHVPLNKSYACARKIVFITNMTEVGQSDYKLIIEGMQVEAFTGGQKMFDDAWDCVGFFTIPIWMGLFAGILLTFIFLFGMFMLLDIKTMDRFDDPKGKHLVLTGSNE